MASAPPRRCITNKKINELTLAEIAMIAGLPKAPSKYNPVNNPKRAMIRRDWILGTHCWSWAISSKPPTTLPSRRRWALTSGPPSPRVNAPWLAEMVREALVTQFGESIYSSGYKVYTTVSAARQNAASQAVINGLLAYDRRHGWRGAEARGEDQLAFRYPVGRAAGGTHYRRG
jgi:penicillin-binding protein 1A